MDETPGNIFSITETKITATGPHEQHTTSCSVVGALSGSCGCGVALSADPGVCSASHRRIQLAMTPGTSRSPRGLASTAAKASEAWLAGVRAWNVSSVSVGRVWYRRANNSPLRSGHSGNASSVHGVTRPSSDKVSPFPAPLLSPSPHPKGAWLSELDVLSEPCPRLAAVDADAWELGLLPDPLGTVAR